MKVTCDKCNKKILVDVPFIINGYKGYTSMDHGCGPEYCIKVLYPTTEEILDELLNLGVLK